MPEKCHTRTSLALVQAIERQASDKLFEMQKQKQDLHIPTNRIRHSGLRTILNLKCKRPW